LIHIEKEERSTNGERKPRKKYLSTTKKRWGQLLYSFPSKRGKKGGKKIDHWREKSRRPCKYWREKKACFDYFQLGRKKKGEKRGGLKGLKKKAFSIFFTIRGKETNRPIVRVRGGGKRGTGGV